MSRFIIALLLTAATSLSAQELFNVRIGTFQDVRSDDFANIRELGFVYGLPLDGQLTEVYIGNYSGLDRAQEVSEELVEQGFRNAAPFEIPLSDTAMAHYIQIALRGRTPTLDWPQLQQAGTLAVEATDGVTKVLVGPYDTEAAAATALTRIRESGYSDAFTRRINAGKLIKVGLFETGIKKPLIPIDLTQAPVRASRSVGTNPPAPSPAPAPAPAPVEPSADTATTATAPMGELALAVQPVPVSRPSLPEIDVATKRHSAAELQRVLKEKGYYEGSVDGLYGPGTEGAFSAAWNDLEELKNYRLIAGMEDVNATTSPTSWPEMLVLQVIAEDMAAGLANLDREKDFAELRKGLFTADTKLGAAESSAARNWEATVIDNLNDWAAEDPLHARIFSALRVAYYQSQVRLEAMYQERGLSPIESRDLATAALRNVLSADLDRFL